jgi:hypothetical protein
LSSSGQLKVWPLENPRDFEKENLGCFMVEMELYRLIFCTKMILGGPVRQKYTSRCVQWLRLNGIKPSSLSFLKVLKHNALVWGPDVWAELGIQPGAGVTEYFFPL